MRSRVKIEVGTPSQEKFRLDKPPVFTSGAATTVMCTPTKTMARDVLRYLKIGLRWLCMYVAEPDIARVVLIARSASP